MEYNTFIDNLKKNNLTTLKLDISYNQGDSRCWTVLINPESENVIVTYCINRTDYGDKCFDILSSKKIIKDVSPDEIFDVISNQINKQINLNFE